MKELTENELKVLTVLDEDTDTWAEHCIAFDWIMEESKLSRKDVSKACKGLREKGLACFYRGLMTEDGEVAGSGYCISNEGKKMLNPCDVCGEIITFDYDVNDKGSMDISLLKEDRDKNIRIRECETHYKQSPKLLALLPTPPMQGDN